MSPLPQKPKERYLVLGGSGLLGSHIVQALVDRRENAVAVFSQSMPIETDVIEGVTYLTGNILDAMELRKCFAATSPTVVFHTVSPSVKDKRLKGSIYYDVNVEGTRLILNVCQDAGAKVFIYTSSTSAVWSGQVLSGPNEDEVSIPEKRYSLYAHSKGLAEKIVIRENGAHGMKTAALRPCGMIGPRDRLSMWRLAQSYEKGQHKYQMGDNKNLVDYSYVGNIADAHILAADCLLAAHASPSTADLVSGEAFFLSDGVPRPFWDLPRLVWKHLGDDGKDIVILPRWFCLVISFFSELYCQIFGGIPSTPRYIVDCATLQQWYSIEKARTRLGYEPRVPLEEGIRLTVEWWNDRGAKQYAERMGPRKNL